MSWPRNFMAANPTAKRGSDKEINHCAPEQPRGKGPRPPVASSTLRLSPSHAFPSAKRAVSAWASGGLGCVRSGPKSTLPGPRGPRQPPRALEHRRSCTRGDGACKPHGDAGKSVRPPAQDGAVTTASSCTASFLTPALAEIAPRNEPCPWWEKEVPAPGEKFLEQTHSPAQKREPDIPIVLAQGCRGAQWTPPGPPSSERFLGTCHPQKGQINPSHRLRRRQESSRKLLPAPGVGGLGLGFSVW